MSIERILHTHFADLCNTFEIFGQDYGLINYESNILSILSRYPIFEVNKTEVEVFPKDAEAKSSGIEPTSVEDSESKEEKGDAKIEVFSNKSANNPRSKTLKNKNSKITVTGSKSEDRKNLPLKIPTQILLECSTRGFVSVGLKNSSFSNTSATSRSFGSFDNSSSGGRSAKSCQKVISMIPGKVQRTFSNINKVQAGKA